MIPTSFFTFFTTFSRPHFYLFFLFMFMFLFLFSTLRSTSAAGLQLVGGGVVLAAY